MERVNYFLIIVVLILISACSSTKQKADNSKFYSFDGNGLLKESSATTGLPYQKQITFSSSGQSLTFYQGEIVKVDFNEFDFTKNTIKITYDEETNTVKIASVSLDDAEIYFYKKCETIIWENTNILPAINISEYLAPEQIIITPYFNDDCIKIGYEFRYGSTERGCRNAGRKVLKKFNNCVKQHHKNNKKSKKKTKQKSNEQNEKKGSGPW